MARYKQPIGKSRQFTVEEVQAYSPFDTNDVSIEELRASVNLEGEDPRDLLQFVNVIPLVELLEEQATLEDEMNDDNVADVTVEPKVEQTDDTTGLQDTNMENDDAVHGLNKISAGVTALPQEPQQDPQLMEIEAQVLDVLDDTTMTDAVDDAVATSVPDQSDIPVAGESSASASRPV